MIAESDALHRRVRAFVDGARDRFDAIALAIARHQHRHVPPVRRLYEAAGIDPERLDDADAIVALPTEAFRLRRVAAHPAEHDERRFRTSGTTGGRGLHPMRTTATYAHAACAFGRRMLFPDVERLRVVALLPSETQAPDSSLTFMVARFAEALGGDASYHFDGERLDIAGLSPRLDRPVLLTGTSFAFVHLLERAPRMPLADGSRVMHTGGFKGRSREVEPAALRSAIAERLDLRPERVVGEYGMTELSSQLYQPGVATGALEATYLPPPWLRVTAVDPASLAPLPAGSEGLARFVDLGNVDSAVAVLTADRIVVREDDSVELLGRQPGATPRGCSLALEPLLEA